MQRYFLSGRRDGAHQKCSLHLSCMHYWGALRLMAGEDTAGKENFGTCTSRMEARLLGLDGVEWLQMLSRESGVNLISIAWLPFSGEMQFERFQRPASASIDQKVE